MNVSTDDVKELVVNPSNLVVSQVSSSAWTAPTRCFATATVYAHRDDMQIYCYIDSKYIGRIAAYDTSGKRDDYVAATISFFINQGSVFSTNYAIDVVSFWAY